MNDQNLMNISRRSMLISGGIALSLATPLARANTPNPTNDQPVVLVHGAWHGGWCWRDVRQALTDHGIRVFTPTLTGMGDRNHLASAQTNLSTHIQDIVAMLEAEELENVLLVGHSYAGFVISGVMERAAARVSHQIYLDALVPEDGESMLSGAKAEAIAAARASLAQGYRLPPWPPEAFGVEPDSAEHKWLSRQLTDMPWGCLTQEISLTKAGRDQKPATYIACTAGKRLAAPSAGAMRARQKGWEVIDVAEVHDIMVTNPLRTADLIMAVAKT